MSGVVLAKALAVAEPLPLDDRMFRLWSADRTRSLDLNADPYRMLVGAVGMESPDVDVALDETPSVPGGEVGDVEIPARELALPMRIWARSPQATRAAKAALRAVLRPGVVDADGLSGWLECSSSSGGVREIGVTYRGGLEGADPGLVPYDRFGLSLLCPDPLVRDTVERALPFHAPGAGGFAMVSSDPAAAAASGIVRGLGSSTVLGEGLHVQVVSDFPTYSTLAFTGPFTASMRVQSDSGLDVTVPAGLAAGASLLITTAPRGKTIRLNGAPHASSVSWGSTFAPLAPGTNVLAVYGAGGTSASSMTISWRGRWRSLW